jgi:hypothetical protein
LVFLELPIKRVKAEHVVAGIPLGLFILGLGDAIKFSVDMVFSVCFLYVVRAEGL